MFHVCLIQRQKFHLLTLLRVEHCFFDLLKIPKRLNPLRIGDLKYDTILAPLGFNSVVESGQ